MEQSEFNRNCPLCNQPLSVGFGSAVEVFTGKLVMANEDWFCPSCGYAETKDVTEEVLNKKLLRDIMEEEKLQTPDVERFLASLPKEIAKPERHSDPYTGDPRLEWDSDTEGVFSVDFNESGMISYAGLYNDQTINGSFPIGDPIPQKVVDWLLKHFKKVEDSIGQN